MEELPSSPGTESATVSELTTPLTLSGRTSPFSNDDQPSVEPTQKKKKKKKTKKPSTVKGPTSEAGKDATSSEARSPVLCISRNKHWKYISSYHGPWLQLPVELLDTLLTVNLNPATMVASEIRLVLPLIVGNGRKHRDRGILTGGDSHFTPPESLQPNTLTPPLLLPPPSLANKPAPPQIDPAVFKSVLHIRRLIDEASELSVRATSGLSAAELGSLRSGSSMTANSWATAHSLGINPSIGGRNVTMSANRIYRLRALAVQKLAQAYKTDEIASSVMVMQGGSVFDDIAERVLKVDPDDVDAKYVHFFHEKIPSRQLAESTTTKVLDELIAVHPQRLEYYRTRGIVHCFRDEFAQAIKDFTFALKETRSNRKARLAHHQSLSLKVSKKGKRPKGAHRTNGQAPAEGTSVMENDMDGPDTEHVVTRPSSSEDVPDPLEPQLLFFRGTAYLQEAVYLIESAVLDLEGIEKTPSADGAELRLCYIENGKYGGVEIGNPEGPLGKRDGEKLQAYAATLGEKAFKDHISQLLKRSMRDHEKFQSHFDFIESDMVQEGDIVSQIQHAFLVIETNHRHGMDSNTTSNTPDSPAVFATYHPLLIESLFTVLVCQLMLADFEAVLPLFIRTAAIAEGSEGYPVFLPPRSMAQAEFIEVLERLARGWRKGIQPHSLSHQRGKGRVVDTEKLPLKPSPVTLSPPVSRSSSYHELETDVVAESSSSTRLGNGSIETQQVVNEALTLDTALIPTSSEGPSSEGRSDAAEALNCARILLTPVAKRQRDLAQIAAEKPGSKSMKLAPVSIPLHGPKVEIILAWLGAVHLPELDG